MDNLFRYRFHKSLELYGIALLIALSAVSLTQRVSAVQQPSSAARELLDPEGKPLPFRTNQAVEMFLQTAQVISSESIGEGITRPRKVLLEKDGVRMHAKFSDFHEERSQMKLSDGSTKFFFRDQAVFECAAYELGKLLGLDNIPPAVARRIRGKKGALQAWIEQAMTERGMREDKIEPPSSGIDRWRWMMQWQVIHFFDNLIYNEDRNRGNVVIASNWKLWMIDHTRAFRRWKQLIYPEKIRYCERNLFEKLQKLDETVVRERLKDFLIPYEIDGLLERKRLLVDHIQKLIAEHGSSDVLFTLR
ncbi:hypothetical protein MYX82_00945 [Acidobacteria bacterium AH-259-D05]|nr:hypothetical protein [Acidobacteria bacterium AH-259-D05]